jgi:hypothetical protein
MSQSPTTEIPDGEILYRYCSPFAFPPDQEEIPTSVFQDANLSCDWERYRPDPRTSFHLDEGKTRLILITVCDEIRNPRNPKRQGQIVIDWHQDIIHNPLTAEQDPRHGANPAHSLVRGKKKRAVQDALVDNSRFIDL